MDYVEDMLLRKKMELFEVICLQTVKRKKSDGIVGVFSHI